MTLLQQIRSEAWLIWSHEHSMWWRPGWHGYTERVAEAGRYTLAEAKEICRKASLHMDGCWTDNAGRRVPHEVIVPSPELLDLLGSADAESRMEGGGR